MATQRLSYGDVLLAQGHFAEARQQMEMVLREQPDNFSALLKLGGIWRQDTEAILDWKLHSEIERASKASKDKGSHLTRFW